MFTFLINTPTTGFHISGRKVIDSKGNEFLMRGINHPHTWYESQSGTAIPAIARTGANCVRIVLSNGKHAENWGKNNVADLKNVLKLCKDNSLIAIVEVHDCTGYPEKAGSAQLSTAVDYWIEMKNELVGQEAYVILNIANEPFGNNVPSSTWVNEHKSAVKRLRENGFNHMIMIDAANWGQDWEKIMLANASQVFSADTKKNIVFSIHMYDVYSSESIVDTYLKTFITSGLPLVVGEFAADHGANKPVAAQAILNKAMEYRIGYIGWSWKGNSGGIESLDIAHDWNGSSLTTWGKLLITGKNGIKQTSQTASVFTTETDAGIRKKHNNLANPEIYIDNHTIKCIFTDGVSENGTVTMLDLKGCAVGMSTLKSVPGKKNSVSFERSHIKNGIYLITTKIGNRVNISKCTLSN
jgi:mannan endo-1,4-beta-mannosidase